ncbi:hypothetical protein C2G38_2041211 [Gigaspora rosea]|uniref:Uncharacterized protein n=1 Tax=Gigaspora rosea TaxID=44941 RepID=A0A397USL2_9GLOM|nr:hypothetical protein C2G38_2041211 [Gigaspora rosea]
MAYWTHIKTVQFLTNKQLPDNQSENIPIANPIITTRRGRPPGKAKSDVEIQDSITKKRHNTDKNNVEIQESNTKKYRYLSNTDTNIQPPDNRKQCQRCSEKDHNRATCKAKIS